MNKSHIFGIAFICFTASANSPIQAATITYTDSYNYYNPNNPGRWQEEWLLVKNTSPNISDYPSWTFDLTTQGFNPLTERVLSVELSVRLADDSVVINGGTGDGPSGDPTEQAKIYADSQTFLTGDIDSPQTYTFQILPNALQNDGILIITATTVPDNYGDFVIDRSSLVVETSTIPIPAAFWLFGSGLVGLIGIARRKANA